MDNSSKTIRSPAHAQWVAVVAVFGAAWGAGEISLGALLRSAAIPLHGTVMTGIGIIIMLVARRTLQASGQRARGSCLAIGVVAAAIVPLSVSRGITPAIVGILAEAACVEIVLGLAHPRPGAFGLAGLFAALVPPVQFLLWLAAQYGPAALSTYREILLDKQGGAKFGLAGQTAGTLLALSLVVSAAYGLVCGILGWTLANQILRRLGREPGQSPRLS
jgi:hypothetical protein